MPKAKQAGQKPNLKDANTKYAYQRLRRVSSTAWSRHIGHMASSYLPYGHARPGLKQFFLSSYPPVGVCVCLRCNYSCGQQ